MQASLSLGAAKVGAGAVVREVESPTGTKSEREKEPKARKEAQLSTARMRL